MKKGFTLIELLAVIVVLGIIALIAVSTISGIIKKTKKSAALRSVEGYVEAANNAAVLYDVDNSKGINVTEAKHTFTSDVDSEVFSKIKAKGTLPTYSYIDYDFESNIVSEGHFCINGYSVLYSDGTAKISESDYCSTNDEGGEAAGTCTISVTRETPVFKYEATGVEDDYIYICDAGEWTKFKQAGLRWDGYIYNNGVYDENYFNGETTQNKQYDPNNASSLSKNSTSKYFDLILNNTGAGPAGYSPATGVWVFTKPIHIDKQCRIKVTFDQQSIDGNYASTYANIHQRIFLRADTNASDSNTVLSSSNILSESVKEYTFDLRNDIYLGRDLYLGVSVGYPVKTWNTVGSGWQNIFRIKTIQMIYD